MAVRVLSYTALLYQDLLRTRTEPLPPVLPIVLHHGPGRWTAAMDVAGLAAPSGAFLAPYQPAQRYFLLDVGDYTDAPLPHGRNLVAALVRLERSRSDADAEAVLGALDAWLSESGNEALRRAVGEWMRQVHAQRRSAAAARPDAENRTEVQPMLREGMQEWMAAKWAEGRADGQLELIRRMAARKFGGETAERLAERLEPVHDAERLAEINAGSIGLHSRDPRSALNPGVEKSRLAARIESRFEELVTLGEQPADGVIQRSTPGGQDHHLPASRRCLRQLG